MTGERAAGALRDRVAVVTGASRGIGAAVAKRFAAEGARVAAVARTVEEGDFHLPGSLARTVADIRDAGGEAVAIAADLASPDADRAAIVQEAADVFGAPVDVLVNNAAAAFHIPTLQVSERRVRVAFEVNVWSPWALTQAVLPAMLERGEGWVVNISTAAVDPPPGPPFSAEAVAGGIGGSVTYGGSKAMLERMTVGAAVDLYGRGVRLNALRPTSGVHTEGADQLADWTGVLVEPIESMTEAVLALATCDAACTGRVTDSLHLLLELDRPVRDLTGRALVEGWQPVDIPAQLAPFGAG
jgi:NAD(P)-dependent dehydrogenase (short-subunit alcohol dehydrogenase family)